MSRHKGVPGLTAAGSLHELWPRLLRNGDLASLLHETLDAAIEITCADMGNIQLVGADGALCIEAQRGFCKAFLDFFNTVEEHEAACGTALARGRRIIIDDVERSPIFVGTVALGIMLEAGARAVQSTPLRGPSGKIIGMLSTHYGKTRRPRKRDLQAIDWLAQQAAHLIERRAEHWIDPVSDHSHSENGKPHLSCNESTGLLTSLARAARRHSERARQLGKVAGSGCQAAFLTAFAEADTALVECSRLRRELDAHRFEHGCEFRATIHPLRRFRDPW